MKILFNTHSLAMTLVNAQAHNEIVYSDLEANYFTPYGLFIPLYTSGVQLIRALRGEFPLSLLKETVVNTRFVHITARGDVWFIGADSKSNDFSWEQVTTEHWIVNGFGGSPKSNAIAYGHLLKGCKTIDKAVERLDRIAYDGFYQPAVFKVTDIATRLQELGHTKPFISHDWSDL